MSIDTLKNELAQIIIADDLPFQHVESKSLLNFVELLNPDALEMMVKADAITDHVIKMYFPIQTKVKDTLKEDADYLNCTCDVWTSPNNDPIIALTGHWLSLNDGELKV